MAVGLLVLAVGAAATALVLISQGPEDAVVRTDPAAGTRAPGDRAAVEAAPGRETEAQAAARARAPAVGQSDAFVREALGGLGADGAFQRWLAGGELARRMSAVLMSVSQGELPRSLLAAFAPKGTFEVETRDAGLFVRPETFARYDEVTRFVTSVDPQRAAAAFVVVEPVLERALREVAPPRVTLRQTAGRATAHLLAVPVPDGDVEVVEKGAVYAYADPQLEALSAVQKQLLRLGPSNARAVQEQLRALRDALGLPANVR